MRVTLNVSAVRRGKPLRSRVFGGRDPLPCQDQVSEGFEQLATDKPKASFWRELPDSPADRPDFEMFSGRRVEMEWLAERILRRRQSSPIVITGLGGVGKTTLLRMFFASYRTGGEPAW